MNTGNEKKPGFVATLWEGYCRHVVPADAPQTQIEETRRAFYAGAEALLSTLLEGFDEGPDVTPRDITFAEGIVLELQEFVAQQIGKKEST